MSSDGIIIIGAGHSGCKAASALRKQGWTGQITMIGKETCAPYDRPPLSKAVLLGKKAHDQCAFFPLEWYRDNGVELMLGRVVRSIDRASKAIYLDTGDARQYEKLLIATGAELNLLPVPGASLSGVEGLRTPEQAARIALQLETGRRIVIVGAGFIGLEAAAAAREMGCEVHVIEAAPKALGRSLPTVVSNDLIAFHEAKGVRFSFGATVKSIAGTERAEAVVLGDGSRIAADMVIYGIGVRPNTDIAYEAGLSVDNGVVVNPYLQTSDENIFACGDVTNYFCELFNQPLRLESWKSAEDQADVAARNMLGQQVRYAHVPWFWSNQYALTLQVAGLPTLGTRHTERVLGAGKLYLSQADDGTVVGVCALGTVRDIAMPMRTAKIYVERQGVMDSAHFADPECPLQAIAP